MNTAAQFTNPDQSTSSDTIRHAASIAHQTVDHVASAAATASERVAAASKTLQSDAERYMTEKPLTSLACALAFGFLIGRLTR